MSYRLEDQPEWAGPMTEDPEPGQPRQPVSRPGPAAEAAEAAERQADMFKSAPPDATEIS